MLVTGATGQVGRPLVSSLVADGYEVVLLTRRPEEARALLPQSGAHLAWDTEATDGAWADALDGAAELSQAVRDGTLMSRLTRRRVDFGDFLMVPAGEIHAIGPGLLVYEVQQSSDITYRLDDFGRTDQIGRPRDLHLENGLKAVTAPHLPESVNTAGPWQYAGAGRFRVLVDGPAFKVTHLEPGGGSIELDTATFRALTIIAGAGALETQDQRWPLHRGSSVVIPERHGPISLAGNLIAISTEPGTPKDVWSPKGR